MASIVDHSIALSNGVRVSFQRYLLPPSGRIEILPSSLGALLPAWGPTGDILIASAPEEAFWIGVDAEADAAIEILVEGVEGLVSPTGLFATAPPARQLLGLPVGGAFVCLSWATHIRSLSLRCDDDRAFVRLARAGEFETETGKPFPAPAQPEHGYQGHRLP